MRITTYMLESRTDLNGAQRGGEHSRRDRRRFNSAGVVLIVEAQSALALLLRGSRQRSVLQRRLRAATGLLVSILTRGANGATGRIRRQLHPQTAGPALAVLDADAGAPCDPWTAMGPEPAGAERAAVRLATPLCRFSGP
jgi:hypothetical protein